MRESSDTLRKQLRNIVETLKLVRPAKGDEDDGASAAYILGLESHKQAIEAELVRRKAPTPPRGRQSHALRCRDMRRTHKRSGTTKSFRAWLRTHKFEGTLSEGLKRKLGAR